MLAWRAEGAAPKGAPSAPDSTNTRRETSQVEMLLVSYSRRVVPLRTETGERGQVPKSVREPGCCSLQGASEMQEGQGDGTACPKSKAGGVEREGLW